VEDTPTLDGSQLVASKARKPPQRIPDPVVHIGGGNLDEIDVFHDEVGSPFVVEVVYKPRNANTVSFLSSVVQGELCSDTGSQSFGDAVLDLVCGRSEVTSEDSTAKPMRFVVCDTILYDGALPAGFILKRAHFASYTS
jgi:hypothetical protein